MLGKNERQPINDKTGFSFLTNCISALLDGERPLWESQDDMESTQDSLADKLHLKRERKEFETLKLLQERFNSVNATAIEKYGFPLWSSIEEMVDMANEIREMIGKKQRGYRVDTFEAVALEQAFVETNAYFFNQDESVGIESREVLVNAIDRIERKSHCHIGDWHEMESHRSRMAAVMFASEQFLVCLEGGESVWGPVN